MGLGTKIGAEDSDGASMSSNAKIVSFQRYPVIAISFAVNMKASKMSGMTSTMVHEISNGICKFSPTSTKGKTVFLFQTILLSFTPIMLLIVQNR